MTPSSHVVDPEGLRTFESPSGEGPVVVRATGDESGGYYDLVETTIRPGPGATPMHVHRDNDEAVLVLEGELTIRLGDTDHTLGPGAYAMAPRGLAHTYRRSGDGPARVLFAYTPGNHWRYLEEAVERGLVEDESDVEALRPVLEAYGIELVGPPMVDETTPGGPA